MGFGRSAAVDAVTAATMSAADPVLVADSEGNVSLDARCSGELLSSRFQLMAYQLRERRALAVLYAAYEQRKADGQDPRAAWLAIGTLAVEVGRAFADRWVFESFLKDNLACPDTGLRPHLDNLRCLYVDKLRAWVSLCVGGWVGCLDSRTAPLLRPALRCGRSRHRHSSWRPVR